MLKDGTIQQNLCHGSTFQKYRSTVVGGSKFLHFLMYECSIVFILPLPGTLGIHLRRFVMPYLFIHFGKNNSMHRDVVFRRPQQISIGNRVTLEEGVMLDIKGNEGFIKIHNDVHIDKNTILSCPGGSIVIGKGTRIGKNCRLGSLKGLTIGEHTVINDNSCIVGAGHAYQASDIPIIEQPLTCRGSTVIEDYVIIEKEVTVLDGIHIGAKSKILARSLVNTNTAANCTVVGVPGLLV